MYPKYPLNRIYTQQIENKDWHYINKVNWNQEFCFRCDFCDILHILPDTVRFLRDVDLECPKCHKDILINPSSGR
jgi:hypothetical protein